MVLHNPKLIQFKQPLDWSCGVYALRYLLFLSGVKLRPTEDDLGTNEIDGTLPGAITEYLYRENVLPHATFTGTAIEDVPKPCLVLYRWYRDDHYSVVTRCTKKRVWLFNPGNGKVESLKLQDFEDRWWTKRPSSRTWALTLERYGK